MRLAKRLLVAVLLLATLALAGCGTSERDQVKAKVLQLARASASRDYRVLCEQVLAPSLVRHLTANGISCQRGMQVALAAVSQPTVSVGRVTVDGNQASAITLSFATGQQASLATVELVRTGAGWRVWSVSPTVG